MGSTGEGVGILQSRVGSGVRMIGGEAWPTSHSWVQRAMPNEFGTLNKET